MASGDTLCRFTPLHNVPPTSAFATIDLRNNHPILAFDDAADESAVFGDLLPRNYDGGGTTLTIVWLAATATSGDVVWNLAWERHQDDVTDLDTDSFAAANATTATCASASGEPQYSPITFTDGADMDSVAAGESFRLKATRDADNGSDTMTGDAQIIRIEIQET